MTNDKIIFFILICFVGIILYIWNPEDFMSWFKKEKYSKKNIKDFVYGLSIMLLMVSLLCVGGVIDAIRYDRIGQIPFFLGFIFLNIFLLFLSGP